MELPGQEGVGDDEGYTSPYEEDFRYNPIPFDVQKLLVLTEPVIIDMVRQPSHDEDENIQWEEVAKLPYIPNRHLTWDNLQVPIPFRFQPDHSTLLKKSIKQPSVPYLSDCMTKSIQFVDCIWKIPISKDNSYESTDLDVTTVSESPVEQLRQSLQMPMYISTKQFIQHAFHLLAGRESPTFLLNQNNNAALRKNPVVLIHGISPTALFSYCKPLLKCGNIVKRLNRYSALHYDNRLLKEEGLEKNSVVTAFLRYISNYLKLYHTILMLNSSTICTLTRLTSFIKPFLHQLEAVQFILDSNPSGNAVDLLSTLNFLLFQNETPIISDLIRGLFVTCASAYLKFVSNWIFRGSLGPPSEFHIEKTRSSTYRDRRFWTKQFSHKNAVPMFLEDSVEVIFETGKAINLLNQIQDEVNCLFYDDMLHDFSLNAERVESQFAQNVFGSIPLFCYDTDVLLTLKLEFEDVAQLHNDWKEKLNSFLKEQSFLTDGISLSIEQVLTCKDQGIDFEAIENARIEREKVILAQKLDEYQSLKSKKKEFLEMLQEQMDESSAKKLKQAHDSRLEDDANNEYWAMKYKRDVAEEKRHRMKHFGDEDIASMKTPKGTYWRLHSAPAASHDTNLDNSNAIVSITGMNQSNETTMEEIVTCSHDEDKKNGDRVDNGDQCFRNNDNVDWESKELLEEVENLEYNDEKFNPDNIITKPPPPYNTCMSLDSEQLRGCILNMLTITVLDLALSQISLMEFVRAKEDRKMKATEELVLSCRYDSYCLSEFLSQSIAIPLNAQNRMVNAALLHYFVCEKNLFFHLEALNNFLCLQNGLFGNVLSSLLIQEVNRKNLRTKEDIVCKSGRLSMILVEALSTAVENEEHNEFIRNLAFTINKDFDTQTGDSKSFGSTTGSAKERTIYSEFEVLDTVRLCYAVDWPLNILLTDDILHHYEKLFVFLMKLFRAELLLQGAFTVLKCKNAKSPQLFTLNHYRYILLHFVTTVRNYVNVTVIHTAWNDLCSAFTKMDSLEKIYEYLVRHIKAVSTNCLLGAKAEGAMKLLTDQLVIIEIFCSQLDRVATDIDWAKGEEIPSKDFKKIIQKFKAIEELGKVFTDVAYKLVRKGIYPKVSYYLELYNFNGYFKNKGTSG